MLVERLHPLIACLFKQLMHQSQQLTIDLFLFFIRFEAHLYLPPHFMHHLFRVAQKHGAYRCADDDDELGWLPQGCEVSRPS